MDETSVPTSDPTQVPEPVAVPASTGWRNRFVMTGDRLIHEAASRLIRIGRENPRLREAGYWLYGTATRHLPRGRDVAKLGEVGPNVYRGAQPSLRAFSTLREMGVDTVINLRPECDYERKFVTQLGMSYLYMPLPPLDAPTHEVTLDFLRAVTDPANGTVFFHCFHGVDRTGTMAAALRVARDGWSIDEAIAEMREFKIHERAQRVKVDYLKSFAAYWAALPEATRAEVLHRAVPEPEPAEPAGLWEKARAWLASRLPSFGKRRGS